MVAATAAAAAARTATAARRAPIRRAELGQAPVCSSLSQAPKALCAALAKEGASQQELAHKNIGHR